MFNPVPTALPGVMSLRPGIFTDQRGSFVKTYHDRVFRELGMPFEIREEFFSISGKNVIRGMHFQAPPADHAKLVYCVTGAVLDVVLDIRRGSPTFGQVCAEELNAANRHSLFIPPGFAHGFLSLTEDSLMVYKTSAVHDPACDQGVRWNSFGFDWPLAGATPILSRRDTELPPFPGFNSPF